MLTLALSILVASTAVGAQPASLDAIRAAPDAFDGQWARLRGQVDQCTHFSCALCPEEATPDDPQRHRCLALDFDRQRGNAGEKGADFDPLYRYGTVDLVARFNKGCLVEICTDRAPVLFDARILAVLKRRTSSEGLNDPRGGERMIDPPAEAAKPLAALLARGMPSGPYGPLYRVFAHPRDPMIEKAAIVCRSSGKEGQMGTWPPDEHSAIFAPSTEDRFKCFFADRVNGRWVINPD
jgi:hypothetical protein